MYCYSSPLAAVLEPRKVYLWSAFDGSYQVSTPSVAVCSVVAGVEVTSSPVFLDYSEQGVTTRMVPWFLLGYLTVLQTTYNGTAHRGLARTLGILLGSFFGWVALSWYESVAALIAFCAVTVFVDIFAFADRHHPLDGFSRRWGYIGMVFTYTQGLIVTLASEELGGLTGWCNLTDSNFL